MVDDTALLYREIDEFYHIGWGLLWKSLLSRLGLFRELFAPNGNGSGSSGTKEKACNQSQRRRVGLGQAR